jgi:hypothetical protein
VATETAKAKGKDPQSPTSPVPGLASLSITSPQSSPRPPPPPRPSAATKPAIMSPSRAPPVYDSEGEEDEDEDNPFADRNAVSVSKGE